MLRKLTDNQFLQAVLVIAVAAGAWYLRNVLLVIFISFLLSVVLQPLVRGLRRIKVPAVFALLLPVAIVFGSITLVGLYIAPVLVEQIRGFSDNLPSIISQIPASKTFELDVEAIRSYITGNYGGFSNVAVSVTSFLIQAAIGIVTTFVITIYWLSKYEPLKKTLLTYVPAHHRLRAKDIWNRIEVKIGSWFVGQVLISLAVGVLVWVAALLLDLPYAGVLAFIAALLELIPTLGPVLAAVPAVMVGFAESPQKALLVAGAYVLIQQFENHLLTPMLLGRTVNLHPIIIIVSFLVGSLSFGILGALLAVPAALCISSAVDSFRGEEAPQP